VYPTNPFLNSEALRFNDTQVGSQSLCLTYLQEIDKTLCHGPQLGRPISLAPFWLVAGRFVGNDDCDHYYYEDEEYWIELVVVVVAAATTTAVRRLDLNDESGSLPVGLDTLPCGGCCRFARSSSSKSLTAAASTTRLDAAARTNRRLFILS
jgi:hypothetical protein